MLGNPEGRHDFQADRLREIHPKKTAPEIRGRRGLRNWWRRRESNPRPHKRRIGIYTRIPRLGFAMPPVRGQASGTAINLLVLAPPPGCPAKVASLLSSLDPSRRRERSNVAELSREGQFVVGFYVFFPDD